MGPGSSYTVSAVVSSCYCMGNTCSSLTPNGSAPFSFPCPCSLFHDVLRRQIFGGLGLGVMGVAAITIAALGTVRYPKKSFEIWLTRTQRSYTFARAMQFVWPFVIVACAIRAIIMVVELNRGCFYLL